MSYFSGLEKVLHMSCGESWGKPLVFHMVGTESPGRFERGHSLGNSNIAHSGSFYRLKVWAALDIQNEKSSLDFYFVLVLN